MPAVVPTPAAATATVSVIATVTLNVAAFAAVFSTRWRAEIWTSAGGWCGDDDLHEAAG